MRKISEIRTAGAVKRYHTSQTIRQQDIAAHSWHVAQIVLHIHPNASRGLLMAALDHDVGEVYTGDLPAPFKWENPALRKEIKTLEANQIAYMGATNGSDCTPYEVEVLKWSDMMECLMWSWEELFMGNRHMKQVYVNASTFLKSKMPPSDKAKELLSAWSEMPPMV